MWHRRVCVRHPEAEDRQCRSNLVERAHACRENDSFGTAGCREQQWPVRNLARRNLDCLQREFFGQESKTLKIERRRQELNTKRVRARCELSMGAIIKLETLQHLQL